MIRRTILLLGWMLWSGVLLMGQPGSGQNNLCETAFPFCTGTLYNFPAGVNAGTGQPGPCYSCLTTRPNPAWYYMKVLTPGNIIISMHSEPAEDIDFCCWGPFSSQFCCDLLACNKVVDCSYSPAPQETVNINNAITGQYYMLVITNFSNDPCNIIFEQTGGTGTTDCSILPPPATSNSPICAGQTLLLSAQTIPNAIYHWAGPNGFQSNQQNPVIPNAQPVNAGTYYLTITVNGQGSSDTSTTDVEIYELDAYAGPDQSIPNGTNTTLSGGCTGGSGFYSYHWEPANKLVNPDVKDPQTVNLFNTTVFTLHTTDDTASCQANDPVTVNVVGGVLAVNALADPSSICAGASSQLEAFGSGGSGSYSFEWSGPGGFTSNLPNPTVQPDITTTYTVTVNDGYNTATGTVTVTVIQLPIADAGQDVTIPFGTYTFLAGSVSGGSGSYQYSWEPASLLVNANVQYPQTTYLTSTTVYHLTATDLATNCVSTNNPGVSVVVSGGPLNVNPTASPDWICLGASTQLFASAGGGDSTGYEYSWTSNPPGFTSASPDPFVSPAVATTYTVSVTDGFNTVNGSTQVSIYPQPVIHLGPADSTVCMYDTLTLDAGNPGSAYLWSNGATTRTIKVGSAGIGFDIQSYTVEVTSADGCTGEGSITVIFSFQDCTAIGDDPEEGRIRFYPNPASDKIRVVFEAPVEATIFTLTNLLGRSLFTLKLDPEAVRGGVYEVILPELARGIYLARFSGDAFTVTKKLVIE